LFLWLVQIDWLSRILIVSLQMSFSSITYSKFLKDTQTHTLHTFWIFLLGNFLLVFFYSVFCNCDIEILEREVTSIACVSLIKKLLFWRIESFLDLNNCPLKTQVVFMAISLSAKGCGKTLFCHNSPHCSLNW
jgi:hypothetical protein